MKKRLASILIYFALCLFLSPTHSLAGQATLAWDPPDIATDVTGYVIHYGTAAGTYSQSIDAGNTTSYSVSNLIDGQTYYFAVTAYNAGGYQSIYSNEVSAAVGITTPPPQYLLMISNADPGKGTVSGSGISCGDTCLATYNDGTVVSLSATAAVGSSFDGWSGGGCSGTGPCTTTMNANTTIAANFKTSVVANYIITASVSGRGGRISPAGTSSVSPGNSVKYSIIPATGYRIAGVTVDGRNVGPVSSYNFSGVVANHKITATFKRWK